MKSQTMRLLSIVAAITTASFSQPAMAQLYVFVDATSTNTSPPSTSNPGDSWGNAYKHLQTGLARAIQLNPNQNSIEVWVAAGTYRPDEGHDEFGNALTADDETLSFALRSNVAIYGGFDGSEPGTPAGFALRNPEVNITILSGDLNDDDTANFGNRGDNSLHVVTADSVGTTARLDGFVIRGGSAVGAYPDGNGGGILITAGNPSASARIVRCVFIDNQAEQGGGAAYAIKGTPTFINCRFLGNRAYFDDGFNPPEFQPGGAVYIASQASAILHNSVFSGNAGSNGGAIYRVTDFGDALQIINCTFSRNAASDSGGAVFAAGGDTNIDNSILWNNTPDQIDNTIGGTRTLRYCIIQGGWSGSGSNNSSSDPNFVNDLGGDGDAGTLDDDLRLVCGSPGINTGSNALLPTDVADLNLNGNVSETLPLDLAMLDRQVSVVDMGAYEQPPKCCIGDVNIDGVVNVTDLLAVIGAWGACPAAPATCPADITPSPCGDGQVNVSDLLAVIGTWGACDPHCPGEGGLAGDIPQSYYDCQDMCSGLSGDEWANCMQKCFEILCSQGQTEFCVD